MTGEYYIFSEEETAALAKRLGESLRPGDVVAYFGGMGMGKTLFTRALAEGMGLDANQVASPTFTLMHEYSGMGKRLYHFDMYRVSGEENLASTGFFDCLDSSGALAVEWSENIASFLPDNIITVSIQPGTAPQHRRITIEDRRGAL